MTQTETSKLEIDSVVPDFSLESIDGKRVSPRDYKQRANLVIAYMDFNRCSACTNLVRSFAERYPEYRELETEIIVVSPQNLADLKGRVGAFGLPFPVLSDSSHKMTASYLGQEAMEAVSSLFITDRYGALRAKMVALTTSELTGQREIIDWLNLIEMECPECGN